MSATFQIPLDIPDVQLLSSRSGEDGEFILEVESSLNSTTCRRCGREITAFHGYDQPIRLRHLPVFGRDVWIEIRPKRYRCPDCDDHPTTTQRLSWHDPRSPHTKAFDAWLVSMLGNSTVSDVSRRCHVGHDAVDGAVDRCVGTTVDWTHYTQLYTLGIDEIALKKGHKDFVAIITTLDKHDQACVLAILPDRLKETVVTFLNGIPPHLKATVRSVCCDMHEGYSNAVKETLPAAQVVVDRFHVAQYYNKAVDNLRKETLHTLKKNLPEETYQQYCQDILWSFRHHFWSLSDEQQTQLSHFLDYAPDLKNAWLLRHELTTLFMNHQTKAEANQQLDDWKQKVLAAELSCFDKFLTLLETWQDSITNYFEDRNTSGFVEGMNNKLKVIKRRCYGLLNVKRFFQQIQIDLRFARGQFFA
jgi:transposase